MLLCGTLIFSNLTAAASPTQLKEEGWLNQASLLVDAAKGSNTAATQFIKDVRESRTQLRKIMLSARNVPLTSEHRALHSTLVLLDVLLKSAAACQTAGYIVCPPMLMSQLNTILKNAYQNLDKTKSKLIESTAGKSQ